MSQKSKAALLVALILIAAGVFYFDSPSSGPGKATDFTKTFTPLAVENPELQRWKIEDTRRTEYKASGRDLFSEGLAPAPVQRKPDPVIPPTQAATEPPPPPPPSLPANMKFYGWGVVPNGTARRAFLTDGEDVYIVGEGDTLLGRYRIVRIGNGNLEFEEIESGRRNSAPLEEQAAPPA